MKKILLWSFIVGTGALLVTVVMISISVPMLGEVYQPSMFINSVIGCYGIGSPVAYYCLKQSEKLKVANDKMNILHLELKKTNAALVEKVRIDQMTGMLNREYFFSDVLERRNVKNTSSLLLIDADNFKRINDRWGHLTGDNALRALSAAIRSAVRSQDTVGRIGGEEFSVFLPGANHEEAMIIAERIRMSVENILFHPVEGGKTHPLSVSIGGVVVTGEASLSHLMAIADRNLYQAKDSGRNRTFIELENKLAA